MNKREDSRQFGCMLFLLYKGSLKISISPHVKGVQLNGRPWWKRILLCLLEVKPVILQIIRHIFFLF